MRRTARTDNSGKAFRGSQFQFQLYVNEHRETLQRELAVLFSDSTIKIDWRSPLREDRYKEFRDAEFLRKLSAPHLASDLRSFWPKGGPVWDGLALAQGVDGEYCILFEAKSHVPELNSICAATSATSIQTIRSEISKLQQRLGCEGMEDWYSAPYYQYLNRIAHLHWLNSHTPTRLVNVYFTEDAFQSTSKMEWLDGLRLMKLKLGLNQDVSGLYELFLPAKAYA